MNRMLFQNRSKRRPGQAGIAPAGVLVLALTAIALAGGRSGDAPPGDPGDGDPGGGIMLDDEAIGSLPILGGGLVFLVPGEVSRYLPPTFYIAGPSDRILHALVDARGMGYVAMHPGTAPGLSLAVIHGDLHIDLDAGLFLDPAVSTGLMVGLRPLRTRAGLFLDGRLVDRRELDPGGRFPVPVGTLFERGLLKDGADLFAAQAGGGREHVRITAFGGVVSLHHVN